MYMKTNKQTNKRWDRYEAYHKTAASVDNTGLIGVKTEVLVLIAINKYVSNAVLHTLRLGNILPFVNRLKKTGQI